MDVIKKVFTFVCKQNKISILEKLHFIITVEAPARLIWKTITDPHLYKRWTKEFTATSYYEGGWKKGDKIRFLATNKEGKKEGMVSEIAESIFPSFISVRHLGYIVDGQDDTTSEAVLSWAPAYENYSLKVIAENLTQVEIESDVEDSYVKMMNEMWPRALQALKETAESLSPQKIYPCLWFEKEALEATDFYFKVFGEAQMLHKNDFVATFEIKGSKMMAINGGPHYKKTPAVSYFVYCGGDAEIERIYTMLTEGGMIMMPLGNYPWSRRYAFIEDKYGTAWQLDVDDVNNSQKIVPCLLFVNEKNKLAGEAVDYYTGIVKESTILFKSMYGPGQQMPEEVVLFAQFKLHHVIINATRSTMKHDFDFTPGNSLVIECSTQEEIDYYWDQLGSGGQYSRCGWLTDRYGHSWQIIPDFLSAATSDPETAHAVIQAFMSMTKFEIEPLKEAMKK